MEKKYSDDLLQKASELKQQYHREQSKADWSEIEEILTEQGFNIECDENFRCAVKKYESKNGILKKKEEYKSDVLDIKNKELIEQKLELDTKIQEFRDERTYLNKIKRPISRTDNMLNVLRENVNPIPTQSPYMFIKPKRGKRVIVPLMSDGQVGEMVRLEDAA
jgi:hypothetical protein